VIDAAIGVGLVGSGLQLIRHALARVLLWLIPLLVAGAALFVAVADTSH
jgi:hypothetical protein